MGESGERRTFLGHLVGGLLVGSLALTACGPTWSIPGGPAPSASPEGRAAVTATAAPVTPTAAPVTPTAAPVTPTAAPAPATPTTPVVPTASPSPVTTAGGAADTESLTVAVRRVADTRKASVVLIANMAVPSGSVLRPVPETQGIGSGVIIDPAGLIVTNNHVIEGAQALRVVLPDGRTFTGRLVGRDPRTDLAVVKIEGQNLPVAPLAPNLNVQVGDWVVAVGNALGLPGGPTVTVGVVGALGRTIQEPNGVSLQDLIQTDAAINPGNSGGPLFNLKGEVVGINTAGIQGAAGLGFAVSITTIRDVVPQLVDHGRVIRPWIGISVTTNTPGLAARFNLPRQDGLLIYEVAEGSPATRAGLRAGDILIAADGQPLASENDLRAFLASKRPGDAITLTVQRGNNQLKLPVTLGETPPA